MIKILVLDDHEIFLKGLKQVIAENTEIVMTHEARTGPEALDKIKKKDFDLVLLDISTPEMINILRELKTLKPGLPILVLGLYPDEQYATQAFKLGASGYLTRACTSRELVTAIKKVSHGTKYINSSLAQRMIFGLGQDNQTVPNKTLSERENQVMYLIAQGKTNKEMAGYLSVSAKTVSTYRARILEKMNLKNNSELIRYVLTNNPVH
jgi:two-component system, NarL family, invasion response regulator UvrY